MTQRKPATRGIGGQRRKKTKDPEEPISRREEPASGSEELTALLGEVRSLGDQLKLQTEEVKRLLQVMTGVGPRPPGPDGSKSECRVSITDLTGGMMSEAARHEREQRYCQFLENAQEGIWALDREGNTTFVNPRMAHMLGCTVEELWDTPWRALLDPDTVAHAERLGQSAIAGRVDQTELAFVRKDGSRVFTTVTTSPITDSKGIHEGLLACVSDITARKEAETELRLSEQRFRQIYDDAPVMMHSINQEAIILNANKKWLQEVGYSREEVIGRSVRFIMADESAERMLKAILPQFWTEGKVEGVEYQYRRKDGSIMDVLLDSTVMLDPVWGSISLSVVRDVTERKRAERALRESEERFRAIFEGARDSIYIMDRSLRFTHVNRAMEKLFGLPASQIVGQSAEDLFGPVVGKRIQEVDRRVLDGESIEEEHTRQVNGVDLTFHDIKVPLRKTAGEITGLCGFSRNVTERKKILPTIQVSVGDYPSAAMKATLAQAAQTAAMDGIVLLRGESGSGKDFLARWIHDHSRRAKGPFFAINCAAVPHELAESELFGHERGAFTGAMSRKRGLLELAEGGSLLLNEIGELSPALQSKLLTFLDSRSFLRVGGEKHIHVNARLMAATHRNLEAEVARNSFLEALYYRLNVFQISVPPLRERVADIPILVREITAQLAGEMQLTETPYLATAAMQAMCRYHWPGNVRELRNVLERSLMLSETTRIEVTIPLLETTQEEWSHTIQFPRNRSLHLVTEEVVEQLCLEALRRSGGKRAEAARLLRISRDSLYRYLKRVETERDSTAETET